jgi:hypothetical protein
MARKSPSRINTGRILKELRQASKKGDRTALAIALDEMRTLALSPKYWQKYLGLLRNPLARLVDLLVIKQGERIASQKGWKLPRPARGTSPPKPRRLRGKAKAVPPRAEPSSHQPSLFE